MHAHSAAIKTCADVFPAWYISAMTQDRQDLAGHTNLLRLPQVYSATKVELFHPKQKKIQNMGSGQAQEITSMLIR